MNDQFFDSISSTCKAIFAYFLQWERLRHPWAGWTRLTLLLLFPFIIWSHNWLLIGLLVMAFFSHPYWFPVCVDAGEDRHLFTEITDFIHNWMITTSPRDKFFAIMPAVALFIPLVGALWQHSVLWTVYFLTALVLTKGILVLGVFDEHNRRGST